MSSVRCCLQSAFILPLRPFRTQTRSIVTQKSSSKKAKPAKEKAESKAPQATPQKRIWTPKEEALLLKLRQARLSWNDIGTHFPDRTVLGLRCKYSEIAPRGRGGRFLYSTRFSDAERALLTKLREDGLSWPKIQKSHFPDRSISNLVETHRRTRVFGQGNDNYLYRPWSETDAAELLVSREEKKLDFNELARKFGRSSSAVICKYRVLVEQRAKRSEDDERVYVGVRSKRIWSEEDEATLTEMVKNGAKVAEISKLFPNRGPYGLRKTICRIKVKQGLSGVKYSAVDEKALKKMRKLKAEGSSVREIAALMPEFGLGQLRYAYYKDFAEKRKAAGILSTKKMVSRVDEKALAKVMELKAEQKSWKDVAAALPDFESGELKYAYYKAKRAEKKDETDEVEGGK